MRELFIIFNELHFTAMNHKIPAYLMALSHGSLQTISVVFQNLLSHLHRKIHFGFLLAKKNPISDTYTITPMFQTPIMVRTTVTALNHV